MANVAHARLDSDHLRGLLSDPEHVCLVAYAKPLYVSDEVDLTNNGAQRNVSIVKATRASPYEDVVMPFSMGTGEAQTRNYYFRAHGVPVGWYASLTLARARTGQVDFSDLTFRRRLATLL